MSLIEAVRTQLRRANEGEEADRNAEPPHIVSDQNGEEAEAGMHGGSEQRSDRPTEDDEDGD